MNLQEEILKYIEKRKQKPVIDNPYTWVTDKEFISGSKMQNERREQLRDAFYMKHGYEYAQQVEKGYYTYPEPEKETLINPDDFLGENELV